MDLIRVLVGADVRRRWASWAVVVVLIGVVGGATMASVAGWRRTNSAMERFVAYHRPINAFVEGFLEKDDLLAIDGVESVLGGDYFLMAPVDATGRVHPEDLGKVSPFSYDDPGSFRQHSIPIIVAGELADPDDPTQVVVDEEAAELYDLEPGGRLAMRAYTMDQIEELMTNLGRLEPTGETFDLTVTGIVRSPQDVVPHQSVPDVVYLGSAEVHLGPAFDAAHRNRDVASLGAAFGDQLGPEATGWELRVDFDRISREELRSAVEALDGEAFLDFSGSDAAQAREEADRSIRLQASALLAFGLLTAVGGGVLISQALRRQLDEDRALRASLWSLGAGKSAVRGIALAKGAGLALLGAVLAAGVAVALSPLAPVGHARRAEVDPGVDVDLLVLLVGAVALGLFVVVRVTAPAWRLRRAASRAAVSSRPGLGDRAAKLGLPPSVVAGVRAAALGTGGLTVAATVFVAGLGVVGGLAFASSEDRLATDERLWGWTFDAVVGDGNDPTVATRAEALLSHDPVVGSYSIVYDLDDVALTAGGREQRTEGVALEAVRGHIEPMLLRGRAPASDREVALGAVTADRLGVAPGDTVEVDLDEGPTEFTVSGIAVMHLGFDSERIGEGAIVTPPGIERAGADAEPSLVAIDYAPGTDPDEAYRSLQADWGNTVLRPLRTTDVEQLHKVRLLPLAFAGLLAVVSVVTLAFVLVLTVRHRRRDLALLRTLGFGSRQLRTTLAVQATTLVLPATLLGTAAGAVLGRLAWRATAQGMGAPEVHVTPVVAAVAAVVGALVLANLIAAVPGHLAARTSPATVLRSE